MYHSQQGEVVTSRYAVIKTRTEGKFEGIIKDSVTRLQNRIVAVYDGGMITEEDSSLYAGERWWNITQESYQDAYNAGFPIPWRFAEGDLQFVEIGLDLSTSPDRTFIMCNGDIPIGKIVFLDNKSPSGARVFKNMMDPEVWNENKVSRSEYGVTQMEGIDNAYVDLPITGIYEHLLNQVGMGSSPNKDKLMIEVGNECWRSGKSVVVSKRRYRRLRGKKDIGHVTVSWPNIMIRRGSLTNFSVTVHPLYSRRGYR